MIFDTRASKNPDSEGSQKLSAEEAVYYLAYFYVDVGTQELVLTKKDIMIVLL